MNKQPYPSGRKIIGVRKMTREEMDREGWEDMFPPVALVLDDGSVLYPSQDDEGNSGGALFGENGNDAFRVLPADEE